jgi:hypothetical protein
MILKQGGVILKGEITKIKEWIIAVKLLEKFYQKKKY